MSTVIPAPLRLHGLPVLADSTDEPAWLVARAARRVTASEAHAILVGGRATHRRILADKLNGSTFAGNAHTRRGHEREAFLLAILSATVAPIVPNTFLLGDPHHDGRAATPDAISPGVPLYGAEVKSHEYGWKRDDVPPDHYDQCQFGMLVTGAQRWLYGWEVMGEDGEPTLEPVRHVWVEADPKRQAQLARAVDAFLAWWDAGAPEHDDLPEEVDDALAAWAAAHARKVDAERDEKAAAALVREYANSAADDAGSKGAGTRAHFTLAVKTAPELDEQAWAAAEPEGYAEWVELRERASKCADAALALYSTDKTTTRLNIYANTDKGNA